MATPTYQGGSLGRALWDLVDAEDEEVKTDLNTPNADNLTSTLRRAAAKLPEEISESAEKKGDLLMASIELLRAHGVLEVVAHLLLPDGAKITYPGEEDDDEVLEPTSVEPPSRTQNKSQPRFRASDAAPEQGVMTFDPTYVPEILRGRASRRTTKVHETLLWVRQGEVGKIKSVVIKPKGYDKPFQLFCAQLSRSVTRWAEVEVQPPDGDQDHAQVMTRFDEKSACFARIISFNKELELTSADKFDVTVDTRGEAFFVEARTYERDFVGPLPIDQKTKRPVELMLGVATTWYSIPLVKTSADKLVARCVIDAGRQLDTIPIQVDANEVGKCKIRTFLRQPQNHGWLLSWEEDDVKGKRQGAARRGGGGGGGRGDDGSDDSDESSDGNERPSASKRRKVGVRGVKPNLSRFQVRNGRPFPR